jgi:hypothetical protein
VHILGCGGSTYGNGNILMTKVILNNLPKVSLNQWYAGIHWRKRKLMKDKYLLLVKSQYKTVHSAEHKYITHYAFEFKKNALDASNCSAMLKMIEDIIFEDDRPDIIDIGSITSRKSRVDRVTITIEIKQELPK